MVNRIAGAGGVVVLGVVAFMVGFMVVSPNVSDVATGLAYAAYRGFSSDDNAVSVENLLKASSLEVALPGFVFDAALFI